MSRRVLLVGASAAALVFVVAAALALHSPRSLDERILTWVDGHRTAGLRSLSELLAVLGSWVVIAPLTIVVVALLLRSGRRWSALFVALCVIAEALIGPALKSLFGLPRPEADLAVKQFSGHGFPSGHAMAAASLSLALAMVAWPTRWRRLALAGAIVWTLLIGLSRVYLGAHWPSDVAGGWAAGAVLAFGLCVLLAAALPSETTRSASVDTTSAGAHAAASVRVVLFDWGNTLMVDDGQPGSMAEWPRVAAVPGAAEALAALHGRYRLCVATNADDSGADEVMAALGRVGLARFIDRVFSSRDIGARKPDPAFYAAVLEALRADAATKGEPPLRADQVVMIGDNFENDVVGAWAAGLEAIWFNPDHTPLPGKRSASDAEIHALANLPSVLLRG
jgi:membrane-associated phospholipid phosphatase/phosphoglycolate phosphatase-like HAD superfamily hydrolase